MWGKWADQIPHVLAYNGRTDGIPHGVFGPRTEYPMSAHLYYKNGTSATVLCGVVFPGAIIYSFVTVLGVIRKFYIVHSTLQNLIFDSQYAINNNLQTNNSKAKTLRIHPIFIKDKLRQGKGSGSSPTGPLLLSGGRGAGL
jgi:hypothetical protein